MKIGIIGAGQIGGTLTCRLTALGHDVSVAYSRGPETLRTLTKETGAKPVTVKEAARAGEVAIVTIPMKSIPKLPRDLFEGVPDDTARGPHRRRSGAADGRRLPRARGCGGRDERRPGERDGCARRRALRSTRLRREQCRDHQRTDRGARDHRGGVGSVDRREPDGGLAMDEARAHADGEAAIRSDREPLLGRRAPRSTGVEYASQGIRVNAICPGWVETSMPADYGSDLERHRQMVASEPIGRTAQAEEIAATAVWLCSDAASFITGDAIAVDGGMTV